MRIAIDAKSAVLGGAKTYLMNFLPQLRDRLGADGHDLVVWRGSSIEGGQPWPEGIEYREYQNVARGGQGAGNRLTGIVGRIWLDQVRLPRDLRKERIDVLYSSANFGPLRSPCRQVLLVRNSAYFDPVFLDRMPSSKVRANYGLQRWLTLRCIKAADVVLFPSQAMLEMVAQWTNGPCPNWGVAHYGVRHDLFHPAQAASRRDASPIQLLHVSHYCDQKNLGVLLRTMQELNRSEPGRYHLKITAGFTKEWYGKNPLFPNFKVEQSLYQELKAAGVVEDVDSKPYAELPALYRAADLFVFPSYTESFGHPLVEAMATGAPIVAAEVPVNRELCGDAATYFSPFEVADCVAAIRRAAMDTDLRSRLATAGLSRVQSFNWTTHADCLATALVGS